MIVQKLRFLRMNERNLGQNHLNKKPTQIQIGVQESALNSIIVRQNLSVPKSFIAENSQGPDELLPQLLEAREEGQPLEQLTIFWKVNAASFGSNHPNLVTIQEQIRKHETALKANHEIGQLSIETVELIVQDIQDRRDVRAVVQKLAFLRMYEFNFGENHPSWKAIQTEIREQETALNEIIKLEFKSKRNPKETSPT